MADETAAASPPGPILWFDQIEAGAVGSVGGKAANLAELRRLGFPVPDGFVLFAEPGPELERAIAQLGGGPMAVRSSGTAEDLAEASFAGQYESFLNVTGVEAVQEAVARCRESASNSRVATYSRQRGMAASPLIPVLVQRMVAAQAAGVAFSANPVTGDRGEVVIKAVRGLGERLVSGEAGADAWVVSRNGPHALKQEENAITSDQALAIADLTRRAAVHFGQPQDVEWAIDDIGLHVLQSRPMTALPPSVDWTPPGAGYWMRNLRLGEWLPEPVTPLFEDWLLDLLNRGFARGNAVDVGLGAGLHQATVNGWYYSTPQPAIRPGAVLRALLTRAPTIWRFATSLLRQASRPDVSERRYFASVVRRWREEALPHYRALVRRRSAGVDAASVEELVEIVEEVGGAAGEQLWCLAIGGGSAWKIEVALAQFYRRHLAARVEGDVLTLLAGLPSKTDHQAAHLVQSVDWYRPTLGETSLPTATLAKNPRRLEVERQRQAAETECRQVLKVEPDLLRRFNALLELAQSYAQLREEQAFELTLGWPLLRRCVLRLGSAAAARGAVADTEDAFFLTRKELCDVAVGGFDLRAEVEARRSLWNWRRRLAPPLALGEEPRLLKRMMGGLELLRSDAGVREGALRGEPASPGRASGPVRIVLGPDDFSAFQEGEVLVAQATAPAWTPLFSRAAAVVTDGGSLAAHASLVAREYGIPAVVATGDATTRLVTGQVVVVDGSGGFVEVVG